MDKYIVEAQVQLEEDWANELELEIIPQLPGRPRWAGRPDRLDFYRFKVEAEGMEIFDEEE